MGMSGGLFVQALGREIGQLVTTELAAELEQKHAAAYARHRDGLRPLPGAPELLEQLSRAKVQYAIATSGNRGWADAFLKIHLLLKSYIHLTPLAD
jgi:phosphoglycolate phosphatase-like HAD superfamily hydrolase